MADIANSMTLISPSMVEGELRILDTDLATRLGFADPRMVRKLIVRHGGALRALGVISTVEITSGTKGGRPGTSYYLNRKQAIFITAKSETAAATDITIEIIERFDAYERNAAPTIKAPANMVEALTLALEQQKALEAKDQEIAALAPKAEALEELASLDGQHSLRDAAKQCGWTERAFVQKLQELHWVYPAPVTGRKCAYADKVKAGLMDVKNVPIVRSGGQTEGVGQPMITQKGIARLRVILGVQPGKVRPFAKKRETEPA